MGQEATVKKLGAFNYWSPMLELEQLAGLTHQHLRSGKTNRPLQHQVLSQSQTCNQI